MKHLNLKVSQRGQTFITAILIIFLSLYIETSHAHEVQYKFLRTVLGNYELVLGGSNRLIIGCINQENQKYIPIISTYTFGSNFEHIKINDHFKSETLLIRTNSKSEFELINTKNKTNRKPNDNITISSEEYSIYYSEADSNYALNEFTYQMKIMCNNRHHNIKIRNSFKIKYIGKPNTTYKSRIYETIYINIDNIADKAIESDLVIYTKDNYIKYRCTDCEI